MSRKSGRRQDRFFTTVIAILVVCAAGLIAAIALQSRTGMPADRAVQSVPQAAENTPAPMTLFAADSQLTRTPEPETAATEAPTPEPTEEPFEYLPVYSQVDTKENVIAITLDDCSDVQSLKYASAAAEEYGAKLTLLPVAKHLLGEDNAEAFRHCVSELGFQVENRTLNNSSLYALSDFELANEIWTADMAVDYILDMDYGMHLLRTKGGQGIWDVRTHAYLKQLGYDGLLTWSVESSTQTADELKSSLTPGNIYLFNCTKDEVVKLAEFMRFARNRGYRMVTVNELLGFAENSCTPAMDNVLSRQLVELAEYDAPVVEYADGDRAYGVYKLQKMLFDMGYLKAAQPTAAPDGAVVTVDPAQAEKKLVDGVFGQGTRSAIMAFQAARGLPCTGVASAEIQEMIEKEYNAR